MSYLSQLCIFSLATLILILNFKDNKPELGRKAGTSLLLLTFLVNAGVFLEAYQFMGHKHSGNTADRLHGQKRLLIATLHGEKELINRGFKRIEKGEYVYKDKWYDVVGITQEGDSTIIRLARDSYEEELISFLKSFFGSATATRQNQTSDRLKHDILKQYLGMISGACFAQITDERVIFLARVIPRLPPFFDVLLPPPQLTRFYHIGYAMI